MNEYIDIIRQLDEQINIISCCKPIKQIIYKMKSTDRYYYRNKLKLSMNGLFNIPNIPKIIPKLEIDRLSEDENDIIVDGINIRTLHNNMRIFDFDKIVTPTDIKNVLFIDNSRSNNFTFWKDFLYYINNFIPIDSLFVNDTQRLSGQYGEMTQFTDILRSHETIQLGINNLIENSNTARRYIVIDQLTNHIQRLNEFRQLIYNGRHYRIGQICRITASMFRSNVRYVFDFAILNPFNISDTQLRHIYESYFDIISSYQIFKALINELKSNNEFLVYDTTEHNPNIYDRIFRIPVMNNDHE